jgi:hypothetical protein
MRMGFRREIRKAPQGRRRCFATPPHTLYFIKYKVPAQQQNPEKSSGFSFARRAAISRRQLARC